MSDMQVLVEAHLHERVRNMGFIALFYRLELQHGPAGDHVGVGRFNYEDVSPFRGCQQGGACRGRQEARDLVDSFGDGVYLDDKHGLPPEPSQYVGVSAVIVASNDIPLVCASRTLQ